MTFSGPQYVWRTYNDLEQSQLDPLGCLGWKWMIQYTPNLLMFVVKLQPFFLQYELSLFKLLGCQGED